MSGTKKIKQLRNKGAFFFVICIGFFGQLQSQNIDIKLLRNITECRKLSNQNFHKAISFSAYPTLALLPAVYFANGLIKHDSSLIKQSLYLGVTIVGVAAVTYGLKYSFSRTRPSVQYPDIISLAHDNSPSMPSGHTAAAFTFATLISIEFPKWYVIVPSYLWASSVAYSRLYLGTHYPSDVIVGAIVGTGISWVAYKLNKKYFAK